MSLDSSEITQLLDEWSEGRSEALPELMPLIVDDLRHIANKYLVQEAAGHTLQPTALVNEVYLRLVGRRSVNWKNRAQFFAFVASMMRRILVDHARHQSYAKRDESHTLRLSPEAFDQLPTERPEDLVALDDALEALEKNDPCRPRSSNCDISAALPRRRSPISSASRRQQ